MQAQQAGGAVRSAAEFSFGVRLANAVYAYAMYLWKMVWPARLAPLYPHPGNSLAAWQVLLAAVVLIAVTALVWRFRERRYLPVGWLWFLGTLVPVLGLVQVGEAAMADRYAYIPLIGIFVMIAFGVADLAEWRRSASGMPFPLSLCSWRSRWLLIAKLITGRVVPICGRTRSRSRKAILLPRTTLAGR